MTENNESKKGTASGEPSASVPSQSLSEDALSQTSSGLSASSFMPSGEVDSASASSSSAPENSGATESLPTQQHVVDSGANVPLDASSEHGCGACEGGCRHNCESFNDSNHRGKGCVHNFLGCGLLALFAILIFIFAMYSKTVDVIGGSVSDAGDFVSSIVRAGNDSWNAVLEECRKSPTRSVVSNMRFSDAKGAERLICAEITREIHETSTFGKWGFTSAVDLQGSAMFQYYVNLSEIRVCYSIDANNIPTITIFTGALKLEKPVKLDIKKYSVRKSLLPSVNREAEEFFSADFKKRMATSGMDAANFVLAEKMARTSIVESLKKVFFGNIDFEKHSANFRVEFREVDSAAEFNGAPKKDIKL